MVNITDYCTAGDNYMNKGFTMAGERIAVSPGDLRQELLALSQVLMSEIGGSMGPLYGMVFRSMARPLKGAERIDAAVFGAMLKGAVEGMGKVIEAGRGDKTLMDCLMPAEQVFSTEVAAGASLPEALEAMKEAARKGRDATRDMVAKLGRSSRLGERSRGVIDAGAASCCLILETLADTLTNRLSEAV